MKRVLFSLILCMLFLLTVITACHAYAAKPMDGDYRFYDSVEVQILEFGTHGSTTRMPLIQGTAEYILKSDGAGNLVWTSLGAATAPTLDEVLQKGNSSNIKTYLTGGVVISGTSEVVNINFSGLWKGDLIPVDNLVYDLGSLTNYFNNIYADSLSLLTGVTSTGTANFTKSITTGAHFYGDLSKATGYIETDTLNSVVDRGATADQTITVPGIVSTGTVQATGAITAGVYYGDGSNLTGINTNQTLDDILSNGNSSNVPVFLTGGLTLSTKLVSPLLSVTSNGGVSITSDISSAGAANFINAVTASVYYGDGRYLTGVVSTSEIFVTGTQEITYTGRNIDFIDFGVVRVGDTIEVRATNFDESNIVHKDSNETIISEKIFLVSPVVPTPSTDFQASTKKYVDDADAAQTLQTITDSGYSSDNPIYLSGGLYLSGEFISPVFHVDASDTSITTDLTVYGTNTSVIEFSASGSAQITKSVTADSMYGTLFQGDYISLNGQEQVAWQKGRMYYDTDDNTLVVFNDESDVGLNVGEEMFVRVRNQTGVTITNGTVVYQNGISGQTPTIAKAKADSISTLDTIGVATHDIENNTFGYVTFVGTVRDVDTSSWIENDKLYISATTAGTLTNVRPTTGFVEEIGKVLYSNASNGKIYVRINKDWAQDYKVGNLYVSDTAEVANLVASNNVEVGGDVKVVDDIFVNDDAFITGDVSANAFVGDGSGLTNIGVSSPTIISVSGKAGEILVKGNVVYQSSATGGNAVFSKADNTNMSKYEAVGIATNAAALNGSVLVALSGQISGYNTSSFNDGDSLYVSTNGTLTNVIPTNGHIYHIGFCTYSNPTLGKILLAKHPEPYMAVPAGDNIDIRAGDTAGNTRIEFENYNDVPIAWITSTGRLNIHTVTSDYIKSGSVEVTTAFVSPVLSASATGVTVTTDITSTGSANFTESVTAGSLYAPFISSTGNVSVSSSVTAGSVYAGVIGTTGNISAVGTINTGSSVTGGVLYGGEIYSSGSTQITKSVTSGSVYSASIYSTDDITATDNIYASGEVRVTGNITSQGNLTGNTVYTNNVFVNGSANLINSVTGDSAYFAMNYISGSAQVTKSITADNIYGTDLKASDDVLASGEVRATGNIKTSGISISSAVNTNYTTYNPYSFYSVPNNSIYLDTNINLFCIRQGDRRYKITTIEVALPGIIIDARSNTSTDFLQTDFWMQQSAGNISAEVNVWDYTAVSPRAGQSVTVDHTDFSGITVEITFSFYEASYTDQGTAIGIAETKYNAFVTLNDVNAVIMLRNTNSETIDDIIAGYNNTGTNQTITLISAPVDGTRYYCKIAVGNYRSGSNLADVHFYCDTSPITTQPGISVKDATFTEANAWYYTLSGYDSTYNGTRVENLLIQSSY